MLNTIDRTGKVLNLFTPESPTWGVSEIAAALQIPKSTTFDILASLAEIGFLQRTSDERYRLGWRMLVISRRLVSSTRFTRHTHRIVSDLAARLGAVVTVGVWDVQGVFCIANACGNQTGQSLTDGTHLPGHASALGKLLMAQLPWAQVQVRIVQDGLAAQTENTVCDPEVLRAQLISARNNDMAIEHGETIIGKSCVAVGIYQHEQCAVGALSISTPTEKMRARAEEYVRIARRAASAMCR